MNRYLTGSRAEGLDLHGSDVDFMTEINTKYNIKVIPSLDENTSASPYGIFLMSTENVRPGFTLLQYVPQTPLDPFLNQTFTSINGLQYLSSDLYMKKSLIEAKIIHRAMTNTSYDIMKNAETGAHQGKYQTGFQIVKQAMMWIVSVAHSGLVRHPNGETVREHFGWPTPGDIGSITDFGFHLVAVGHPEL